MSRILGISYGRHDAAATLVDDGMIIASAEEERFSRIKHDSRCPVGVLRWMARDFSINTNHPDAVVFYERPLTRLERIIAMRRGRIKGAKAFHETIRQWAGNKIWIESEIRGALAAAGISYRGKMFYTDHHYSHAASAFYPSPFQEAGILTLDGVGEWTSSSIAVGCADKITLRAEGTFPHSLGLFYSTMTQIAGFKVNDGEYKLMGLAPYGEPRYVSLLEEQVIHINPDGSIVLDMNWFAFMDGGQMASPRLLELLGIQKRDKEDSNHEPSQQECDLAASTQNLCNKAVAAAARHAVKISGSRNLVMAGGVALNCVSIGKLLENGDVDNLYVQPAASDAGGALGCALQMAADRGELTRPWVETGTDAMSGAFLGPEIDPAAVGELIAQRGLTVTYLPRPKMDQRIAELLAQGHIVAVARGRMEFGPRALGNRSILADPRVADMQQRLNMVVKGRESFRPFAPAILSNRQQEWFNYPYGNPYMTTCASLRNEHRIQVPAADNIRQRLQQTRSEVPAVTHVDYSARVQCVSDDSPLAGIIQAFEKITTIPMVLNTSFNRRDEPIVASAKDAYQCFTNTKIDYLVLADFLIASEALSASTKKRNRQ